MALDKNGREIQQGLFPWIGQKVGDLPNPFTDGKVRDAGGWSLDNAKQNITGAKDFLFGYDGTTPAPVATPVAPINPINNAVSKFTNGLGQTKSPVGVNGIMNTAPIANPFNAPAQVQPLSMGSYLNPPSNPNIEAIGNKVSSILGGYAQPKVTAPLSIAQSTANNVNGVGAFNPERNNFAVDARQQYTNQLQNLLGQYTNATFNGSESLEQALAKKSARGVLSNQIGTISQQLTNNSNLVQNDINNSSGLMAGDMNARRNIQLQLGTLGLNEQQNQFNNTLNTAKTQNDFNNTASEINYRNLQGQIASAKVAPEIAGMNAEAQLRGIQAQTAQIPLDFQRQQQGIINNASNVNNLDPVLARQYFQSQPGRLAIQQYMAQGLNPDQAILQAGKDFSSIQAQSALRNNANGFIASNNPQAFASLGAKQSPEYKIDGGTNAVTVTGNSSNLSPADILRIKQYQDALNTKDTAGAKKFFIDNQGNQQ